MVADQFDLLEGAERQEWKPPADIRIGTSGYSFLDWIGPFYPEGTARGKMLEHYRNHFDTVEINSTYYRIPGIKTFEGLARRTPPGFEFMVKTHSSFTHERALAVEMTAPFLDAVAPLSESGKLRGVLAQFPYSFRCNAQNLDHVLGGARRFAPYPLFVEYRHDSWLDPSVKEAMAQAQIGYCNVDEPALPHLLPPETATTTRTAYVRLHGRNAAQWWNGGGERYNYSYNDAELGEWIERLQALRVKADRVYVFFNNCHLGMAVKDAKRFMELLQEKLGGSP